METLHFQLLKYKSKPNIAKDSENNLLFPIFLSRYPFLKIRIKAQEFMDQREPKSHF